MQQQQQCSIPFDPPATQHFVFALAPRAKLKLATTAANGRRRERGKGSTNDERGRGRERERERARKVRQGELRGQRERERGVGSLKLTPPRVLRRECVYRVRSFVAPHLCFAISASIPRVFDCPWDVVCPLPLLCPAPTNANVSVHFVICLLRAASIREVGE